MLSTNFLEATQKAGKTKALAFGLAMVVALLCGLLAAKPAHAKTFTVNLAEDAADFDLTDNRCDAGFGACTLRAAIQQANATKGADTINFNIFASECSSTTGVCTINVGGSDGSLGALPSIEEPVTIDGYTQRPCSSNPAPCSKPNTNTTLAQGSNANLLIELDGTNAGSVVGGLVIGNSASNVVVKGLVINRFDGYGIVIQDSKGNKVEGNFIGTDPTGTLDRGNSFSGVNIAGGSNSTIGGTTPDKRNLISGNTLHGVLVGSPGNKVLGNLIGTKKDGATGLGNSSVGVRLADPGKNTVGGVSEGAANTIAFNGYDGVEVTIDSTGNRILSNSIFSNGHLGIDLGVDGVTPNDDKDLDTGANNRQNFPDLTSATISGTQITVQGTFNSTPSSKRHKKRFTIQFFSSPQANPSGFGEGKTFIGQKTVTTNRNGDATIAATFTPVQAVSAGEKITATATDSKGNTSEFSHFVTAS